jgi:hypothetical protein
MSVLINPDTEIQTMDPTNQPSIPPSVSDAFFISHTINSKVSWSNENASLINNQTSPIKSPTPQPTSQPTSDPSVSEISLVMCHVTAN